MPNSCVTLGFCVLVAATLAKSQVPDEIATDLINATSAETTRSADSNLLSTVWTTAKSVTTNKAPTIDVEHDTEESTISLLRSTTTISPVSSSAPTLQTSLSSENRNSPVSRCSMNKAYPCLFPFEDGGKQHYECIRGKWTSKYWCRNAEPSANFAYCEICDENEVASENPVTANSPTTVLSSASPFDERLSSAPKKRISSTVAAVNSSMSPSHSTQFYSSKSKVLPTTYSDAKPDSETQQTSTTTVTSETINPTTENILYNPAVSRAFITTKPTTIVLDQKEITSSPKLEPTTLVERPIIPKSKPATESYPPTQSQDQESTTLQADPDDWATTVGGEARDETTVPKVKSGTAKMKSDIMHFLLIHMAAISLIT